MGNIIIREAALDEFLRSLHAKVTRDQKELLAEMRADLEAFRARLSAYEAVFRAQLAEMRERRLREVDEVIAENVREAADEIARLRQLERLRQTAAIERGEWAQ